MKELLDARFMYSAYTGGFNELLPDQDGVCGRGVKRDGSPPCENGKTINGETRPDFITYGFFVCSTIIYISLFPLFYHGLRSTLKALKGFRCAFVSDS